MTAIELCFLGICLGLAVLGGAIAGDRFGLPGLILGGIAGLISLPLLSVALSRLFPARYPPRPICPTGKCSADQYEAIGTDGDLIWRCACGEEFVLRGRRFLRHAAGLAPEPYRVWRGRRQGWVDDDEK